MNTPLSKLFPVVPPIAQLYPTFFSLYSQNNAENTAFLTCFFPKRPLIRFKRVVFPPRTPPFPRCKMLTGRSTLLLLLFRLCNSVPSTQLFVRSYFTADEYWQSLEVAHNLVWGTGYLTWEWRVSRIRSICYPALFAGLYTLLEWTGLDYPWMVAYAPRLLGGVLMWVSDVYVYKIGEHLMGPAFAARFLALYLSNWFLFYTGVRSYNNSLELVTTVLALYFYLTSQFFHWNISVALGCLMRPTALLAWLPCYSSFLGRWKRMAQVGVIA